MNFWEKRRMLHYAKEEIINALLVDELLELWDICGVKYEYVESDYTADWVELYDNKISYLYTKKFNPLYSYLSTAKGVNVRWALGCKAGNPDLATPKIGSFYFPNFEV